jgi:3-methyl-2-oxobutanoate hydroxymethyltransferase
MALKGTRKIVCLTATTAPMAAALDAQRDLLLVRDSLAMTIYGLESTVEVTVDIMIRYGKAVVSRARTALAIVDLPAGSCEKSPAQTRYLAQKIMAETDVDNVKLEGGQSMRKPVALLTAAGIPVMGHIRLLPKQVA